MTKYIVRRDSDGWFLARYGWSYYLADAHRFDSMTEAALEGLTRADCDDWVIVLVSERVAA
jgi:hypothetical protein